MSCLSHREDLIGTWLVDSERAPFLGAASRLNIANFNARILPLIRPYPPRHHTLMRYLSHSPKVGMYLIAYGYEKTYRTDRARDLGASIAHKYFKSPLYMASPTAADPADRVVAPLAPLPCQALYGYGVPSAHHGEVRGCRRACERTPLRGRRRCPAGGRPKLFLVC
jgi:hypothetical protein